MKSSRFSHRLETKEYASPDPHVLRVRLGVLNILSRLFLVMNSYVRFVSLRHATLSILYW